MGDSQLPILIEIRFFPLVLNLDLKPQLANKVQNTSYLRQHI